VATMYGIPGYDDLVPDDSEEGAVDLGQLTPADAVTLDCTKEAATQELAIIDMARAEHPVTAMPYAGPAVRTGRPGPPAPCRRSWPWAAWRPTTPPAWTAADPGRSGSIPSGPPPVPAGTWKRRPSTKRYPGIICSCPACSCSRPPRLYGRGSIFRLC
jgi:hypothetical protein